MAITVGTTESVFPGRPSLTQRSANERRDVYRRRATVFLPSNGNTLRAQCSLIGEVPRPRPHDATTVCETTTEPEDQPDTLELADINHSRQFIQATKAPPRDAALAATAVGKSGWWPVVVG